jgi:hypothetical protein
MKKYFLIAVALLIMSAGAKAQVTIGSADNPHDFSILELISGGERGLRLPQMTTEQRDALTPTLTGNSNALGLEIFNTTTKCVETWNGSKWIQACVPPPKEEILFTINTTDGTYIIPINGSGTNVSRSYDWYVSVDGGAAVDYHGTSNFFSDGIELTGLATNKTHQIRITPYNSPEPGWGNAFGYADISPSNANTIANCNKLISIDAPLTTRAFAPKTSESTTSASCMFSCIFGKCANLTTPAKIVDTYKLPETITDLSGFLNSTHNSNTNLETPIDLSGLKDWFSNNDKIDNLSYFLNGAHFGNTALKDPIDLTPLSGWFSDNHSIANMSLPFQSTHNGNTSLDLKGQKIFPNWLKTLKAGDTHDPTIRPIKDLVSSFLYMFYCGINTKPSGDEGGEPEFEDSSKNITKLSDLGQPVPGSPKGTYYSRTSLPNYGSLGAWK